MSVLNSYLYPHKNVNHIGKWGKFKKCKKGAYAIGAEIGLNDDYGYSNIDAQRSFVGPHDPTRCYLCAYFASVLNVRLYCSEYTINEDGYSVTRIEGDQYSDFEDDSQISFDHRSRNKEFIRDIHRNQK